MSRCFLRFSIILSSLFLAACGGKNGGLLRLDPGPDQTGPSPLVAEDPAGPIPAPVIPQAVREYAAETATEPPGTEGVRPSPVGLSYTLTVVSEQAPELANAFNAASHLRLMHENPLTTVTGLDQRMRTDLDMAREVLHSYGYYAGSVSGVIREAQRETKEEDENAPPSHKAGDYTVTVTFEPGEQYRIGETHIELTDPSLLHPDKTDGEKRRMPVSSLAGVGLKKGDPALADAVLDAVAEARENFRDRGYPYAKVASTRYVVDHFQKTLDATITMDSGPLTYMGDLEVKGEQTVTRRYLEALSTWHPGQVWNQQRVETFRDELRQSGLFAAAEINPADSSDENGRRAVVAELTPAPERTVGSSLRYDTDFGPGIQGYWENRNLTGRGDKLRVEAPLWEDLQELVIAYRLPFFLRTDQDLIAGAGLRSENTDAYDLKSARASVGVERRLSRRWSGTLSAMTEAGSLKDPQEPRRDYLMAGLPGSLLYDGTNNLLNATKGVRLSLNLAPYTGEYNNDFTVARTKLETQAFFPVIGDDSLVMAFRAMYGAVAGEDAPNLPASIRFYTGGGGSVRGYEYQSLGPRNASRNPLGGSSAVEVSAEARARFNETWGAVAFLDGGMAYEKQTPDFGENELRWGAGVGLRLYTAIGPVRFDVAVPLNPRNGDDNFHIYFSIGQSF